MTLQFIISKPEKLYFACLVTSLTEEVAIIQCALPHLIQPHLNTEGIGLSPRSEPAWKPKEGGAHYCLTVESWRKIKYH